MHVAGAVSDPSSPGILLEGRGRQGQVLTAPGTVLGALSAHSLAVTEIAAFSVSWEGTSKKK